MNRYYHVALHLASGTQSFAAQDIASANVPGAKPGESAAWRLLNPGRNQSSELYIAAETLLTQAPVIFTRRMNPNDLRNIKLGTMLPMFTHPCDKNMRDGGGRYLPYGTPEGDREFFATALVKASRVVCEEMHHLPLKDDDFSLYKTRLRDLDYPVGELKAWHPAQTARFVGIEHTFTFSLNLMRAA